MLFFFFSLLLFDKSSCYVLVSIFVVLGLLGSVMWYVLFFFWFLFGFLFEGFKGQVKWPKGPPQLALKTLLISFVLFLFCFCLFYFSCWVLFVLLFLLLFYLEGFKGQVRWPFGQPHLTLKSSLVVFVVCFWFVFERNQKTLFSPCKKVNFFFICFLLHFPDHSFFLSLTFFLSYFLSYFVLFLSFFLAFFLSFSFSLSPFLFPAFFVAFSSLLCSCILSFFLSLPLFLFFVCLLFSCLSFLALLFVSFCFPCLLEQC